MNTGEKGPRIAVLLLILAMVACVMEQQMGALQPGDSLTCEPVPFTLRGEVDSIWEANLPSNTLYEVTVKAVDTLHPINDVSIWISFQGDDISREAVVSEEDRTVRTRFVSPLKDTVTVRVFSMIGADQQDLGQHSILLCEVEQ